MDSNVIVGGVVAPWGLDKAVLSLCAARVCRLVLAGVVRDEVEENLEIHALHLPPADADRLRQAYCGLMDLARPEIIPYPEAALVQSNRRRIRHEPDVPVLLSALAARPDWLLTHNVRHFTPEVARQNGLRIAPPIDFFRTLATLLH